MTHFELNFACGVSYGFKFFFFICIYNCSSTICWKDYLFSTALCLCQKPVVQIYVWVYFWTSYFVPLIYFSIFMLIPHCLHYCSFIIIIEIRQCYTLKFVCLFQGGLAILCSSIKVLASACQFLQKILLGVWL